MSRIRKLLNVLHKQKQREKQRKFLMEKYGVRTAEALVTKLMKEKS